MRAGLLLAAVALAACQPVPEPESAQPEEVRVRVGPIASAEELEGIYRVAGLGDIDMAELDRGIAVSITGDRIDVLLNCVNTHWIYRFEGTRLVTTAVEDSEPCRRALNPDERAIGQGFDGAERVTRTPSNGILIEGSGPAITLFSQ
jgi:hypothetical protein